MSIEKNMRLWSRVCTTDPKHTRRGKKGKFEFTAIDGFT